MMQEYTQEMKNLTADAIRNLHTIIPGKFVSYDPAKVEASVQPLGKYKKPDGVMIDFPVLNAAPVLFPQAMGQAVTIVYSIKPGDECLILVSEQTLDTWRTGAASNTDLRFDLTNAIVLPGLFTRSNPLAARAQNNKSLLIQREGSFIEFFGDGAVDLHATGPMTITSAALITMAAPTIYIN